MTDNHTELCERLRSHEAMVMRGLGYLMNTCSEAAELIEKQAARIQQQALEYVSLFDQCSQHLARIAELEKERDALKANRLTMARDSMLVLTAAILASGGKIVVDKLSMIQSIDAAVSRIDLPTGEFELRAALQAEKETR